MSPSPVTTLDHINNIVVPGDVFAAPANEYWALLCLRRGMEFLYRQARHCDLAVQQRVTETHGPDMKVWGAGNVPELAAIPHDLVTCGFHWYAMSAYQYALLVGKIARDTDGTQPLPKDYVKSVMPEVLVFRNKVAAHFAYAENHSKDNDAIRLASILPPLTFQDDSIHVCGFTVQITRNGKTSSSEDLKAWSICRVHEQLQKRYWPETLDAGSQPTH